jgi:hypothetical protein
VHCWATNVPKTWKYWKCWLKTQQWLPSLLLSSYAIFNAGVKVPDVFVRSKPNLRFLRKFEWRFPIPNFTKIRPVAAELIDAEKRVDRQTDMTKLFVTYANAPKKSKVVLLKLTVPQLGQKPSLRLYESKNSLPCSQNRPLIPILGQIKPIHTLILSFFTVRYTFLISFIST